MWCAIAAVSQSSSGASARHRQAFWSITLLQVRGLAAFMSFRSSTLVVVAFIIAVTPSSRIAFIRAGRESVALVAARLWQAVALLNIQPLSDQRCLLRFSIP